MFDNYFEFLLKTKGTADTVSQKWNDFLDKYRECNI